MSIVSLSYLAASEKPVLNTTDQNLVGTVADAVFHNEGASLIVASALATSIIIYVGAKSAAEIISAYRKK